MNQSRRITEGALMLAIFMVLLLISVFVPFISIVGMFLLPVPFVFYAAKHGWKPSLLMFVVALILTTIFATLLSLPLAVLMGFGGMTIGTAIHKKVSPYETLARGTLGFIVGLLFIVVSSQVFLSVNFVDQFELIVEDSLEMSSEWMEQIGSGEQVEQMEEMLRLQMEMFIDLLPVFLVSMAVILALLSQWIGYKFINRLEKKQLRFPPFRNLRFPTSLLWIYFFALLFSFFDLDPSSIYYTAVQNLFVITGLIMTVQGFSFIFYYANHKKLSKAVPIFSIVLTILFPTFLLYFVRILGIIDIGFRLRDRLTKQK